MRFVRCRPDFGPGDAPQLLAWHNTCLQEHQEGVHACPACHERHSQQGAQGRQAQHERFDAYVLPKPAGSSVYALGDAACVDFVTAAQMALPALEDTGVQLGTGLATGCDAVFITENDDLVEAERLLPLFDMRSFRQGKVVRRRWLVNPWHADGSLVCLADYPRLRAYLEAHAHVLRKRALVRGSQGHGEGRTKTWYRTIDKPLPGLLDRELLLMPDMATTSDPVLSCGFYPGHTTCWLASDVWDMRVLGAFLLAETTQRFISVLGVAMRGGTLRFQAQYLRLVHLPAQEQVHPELQHSLAQAFIAGDREAATRCAERAYADALQALEDQAAQDAQDAPDA